MYLTDKQCEQNHSIPTKTIERDIVTLQAEVDQYEKKLEALTENRLGNKAAIYPISCKILTRKEFIISLNSILEYRNKTK